MEKAENKKLSHRFSVIVEDFKDAERRKIRLRIIAQALIRLVWVLFRTFIIVGMAFVLLYPILYMISMSFRTISDMYDPSVIWIPRHFTMQNIQGAIKALKYWQSLWNTITLDVVSSIIQVFVCAIVGYGFARFKFKGKGLMFGLVIMTIIVPSQTILISLYGTYRNFSLFGILDVYNWVGGLIGGESFSPVYLSLLNSNLVFYLPALFGMGIRSGLYIFIYRQFFRGLPKELEEAAWIDGCGKFRTFWKVMLPNATAVFVTVFLFSLVWYWNDYFNSSMFINNVPTISTMLAGLKSSGLAEVAESSDPLQTSTYVQAGALLSILPMLILYMIFQRQFTESIERSGIVG